KADLMGAHLPGADLRKAKLSEANLTDAKLPGAILTEVVGDGAVFTNATLSGVNLQGGVLSGAFLDGAMLDTAILGRDPMGTLGACNLSDAYMPNAVLDAADLTDVSMTHARFYGEKASAVGATLINVKFVGAILSGANFNSAKLQNAVFDDAVCVKCSFDGARLEQTATTRQGAASFVGADLRGADFTQATLDGVNFTRATVSFESGLYSYGVRPEKVYTTTVAASIMGAATTLSSVTCPDRFPGPCDTMERLMAPATPTARPPTATPQTGCTPNPPRILCRPTPTATP